MQKYLLLFLASASSLVGAHEFKRCYHPRELGSVAVVAAKNAAAKYTKSDTANSVANTDLVHALLSFDLCGSQYLLNTDKDRLSEAFSNSGQYQVVERDGKEVVQITTTVPGQRAGWFKRQPAKTAEMRALLAVHGIELVILGSEESRPLPYKETWAEKWAKLKAAYKKGKELYEESDAAAALRDLFKDPSE